MARNYYKVKKRLLDGGTYSAGELATMTQSSIGDVIQSIEDLRRHGLRIRSDGRYFWIDGIFDQPESIDNVINQCIIKIKR